MTTRTLEEKLRRELTNRQIDYLESLHHQPGICQGKPECAHEECPVWRLERELIAKRAA